ncbi:MAG: DUF3160 domain-containing protein [Deltaproteobacteria bacterium]|nr:DUF3160 domain-containing protein [Deltaproteobacteria bacterium]
MPHLKKSRIGKFVPLLLGLMFITLCCSERAAPPPAGPTVSLPALELEAFGALPPVKPAAVTPSLKDQAVALDRAVNYQQVMAFLKVRLTPEQIKFLHEHRFLLLPKSVTRFKGKVALCGEEDDPFDEMVGLFDSLSGASDPMRRRPENCRFVNPDVMLHALHKYLENSLEYLEKRELAEALRRFLTNIQAKTLEYQAASSGKLAGHYELIGAQLTVPLVIMENARYPSARELQEIASRPPPVPLTDDADTLENALKLLDRFKGKFSEPIFHRMAAELRQIYAAREVTLSPLYGQYAKDGAVKADYTQFTPRSHYVKSSVLRSYFRAMMYLGRNSYLLGQAEGVSDALLVALILASPGPDGRPLLKDWQRIMEITGFYAGRPDDISYPEWRNFLVKVLGAEKLAAGEALNPATLAKITSQLGELQGPRVLSEVIIDPGVFTSNKAQLLETAKGFRIFGQRFTVDGWILSRLTAGQEQTAVRLPSMPSALFVPAALGDKTARGFTDQYLQQLSAPFSPEETARFNGRLNEVAADLRKIKDPEWFSSVGAVWLKLLSTLTSSYGRGYPLYMQDRLFPVKQLETFLGSYTELKHDTLLYAKQNYAERGGGGDEGTPPPVPKGFVEPNLTFWETLDRLVDYVHGGYAKYGIFKKELEEYGRLSRFKRDVAWYASLAAKELQGVPLTEAEYEKLRLEPLMYMAAPLEEGQILEEKDLRAGLIADLHTDAVQGQIQYEATGEPQVMLVLVGNENTVRLAVGVAFNHYEFTGPLGARYTDADWQGRVYEHRSPLPEKNFWYKSLATK